MRAHAVARAARQQLLGRLRRAELSLLHSVGSRCAQDTAAILWPLMLSASAESGSLQLTEHAGEYPAVSAHDNPPVPLTTHVRRQIREPECSDSTQVSIAADAMADAYA